MLYRLIPAVVAAANGIAVAIGFYVGRVDVYPFKLLMVQVVVVFVTLLFVSRNRAVLGAGFILTVLCIVFSFSAMIWYIPTLAAAVWRVLTAEKYDSR